MSSFEQESPGRECLEFSRPRWGRSTQSANYRQESRHYSNPERSSGNLVSFLAEKDHAFVGSGDEVHLNMEQLPYAESGILRARVVRLNDDLASSYEIREALGEDQKL